MAKAPKGRGGRKHRASMAPRVAVPGRGKPAADLETFLGKAPDASPKIPTTSVVGNPGRPATSTQASAQAREAERCALEGVGLIKQGRPAEAIGLFQRAVQLNPRAAASHHDLGLALMGAGRLEHAAEAFSGALRLDPRLATAHQFLGVILDELGQERKAMAAYQAAVALRPDLVAAQWRLGDLYLKRLQLAEAAATFRAAAAATAGTATARLSEARALVAWAHSTRLSPRRAQSSRRIRKTPKPIRSLASFSPRPVFRRRPRRIICASPSLPRASPRRGPASPPTGGSPPRTAR